MMYRFFFLFSLMVLVISCQTTNILEASKTSTTHQVGLGTVGLDQGYIIQSSYNNVAIPNYDQPIKLSVRSKPFNKNNFKTFLKAKQVQSRDLKIECIDSLQQKPHYVEIDIADKIAVIEALNKNENLGVKNYLSHNKMVDLVTGISIAFDDKILNTIKAADAVFLVENGLKNYGLKIQKEGEADKVVKFTKGVVFAYRSANCCWQEDNRKRLNIVDYVGNYDNCPNKTYRSSERAKKKDEFF